MNIKPCPHCGGVAYLNSNYSRKTGTYFTFVKCDICGAQGKIYSSKEQPAATGWNNIPCHDAVNAWNMRTGSSAPVQGKRRGGSVLLLTRCRSHRIAPGRAKRRKGIQTPTEA